MIALTLELRLWTELVDFLVMVVVILILNLPVAPPVIESDKLSLLSERGCGLPWPEPPPPDFIEFLREICRSIRLPRVMREDLLCATSKPAGGPSRLRPWMAVIEWLVKLFSFLLEKSFVESLEL